MAATAYHATLSPPKFCNEARMAELFGDDPAWRTLLNVTHHDNVLSFTFCAWGTERVVSLSLERHSSHRIVRVSGIGDWTWVPAVNRFLSSILSSQDADHLQRLCEACVEVLAYDEKVSRLLGDLQKLMAADGALGAADVLAMIDNAELKSRLSSFFPPRVPTITVSTLLANMKKFNSDPSVLVDALELIAMGSWKNPLYRLMTAAKSDHQWHRCCLGLTEDFRVLAKAAYQPVGTLMADIDATLKATPWQLPVLHGESGSGKTSTMVGLATGPEAIHGAMQDGTMVIMLLANHLASRVVLPMCPPKGTSRGRVRR